MSSYTLTLKSICGVRTVSEESYNKYSMEPNTDTTFKQDQVLVTHLYALCRK